MLRLLMVATFMLAAAPAALAQAEDAGRCGTAIAIDTHDGTGTRYALAYPEQAPPQRTRVALVLLAGGGGHLDLDDQGCPRALKGNSLVRSAPLMRGAGFITALVDAPSDHTGQDGLGGFRIAAEHAKDLGKVIADVRSRTKAEVWLVGTSRGTISAVNAAARLSGASAPDGLVLTSALMAGFSGGRKFWVAHSVFDLALDAIRVPVLIVGHADDRCPRSPPDMMAELAARLGSARKQVVTVTGGSDGRGKSGIDACVGRSPHGFIGQESEVLAGIARFVNGGSY